MKNILFDFLTPDLCKTECNGRSMVEMLGVLAIVGVLSVGALKGYSSAMFRYKVNQSIDIFSQVLQRFSELEQQGLDGVSFDYDQIENIVTYGFLSSCQETTDTPDDGSPACKLPIGSLQIEIHGYTNFYVNFDSKSECVAFMSAHWENAVSIDWWTSGGYMGVGNGEEDEHLYGPNMMTPPTMSQIEDACEQGNNNDSYYAYLYLSIPR